MQLQGDSKVWNRIFRLETIQSVKLDELDRTKWVWKCLVKQEFKRKFKFELYLPDAKNTYLLHLNLYDLRHQVNFHSVQRIQVTLYSALIFYLKLIKDENDSLIGKDVLHFRMTAEVGIFKLEL